MSDKDKKKRCVRCGYTKAWHVRIDGAPDHEFVSDYEDVVEEARDLVIRLGQDRKSALCKAVTHKVIEAEAQNIINRLADEVETLRAKLNDPCLVAGYHVCGRAHNLSDLAKD